MLRRRILNAGIEAMTNESNSVDPVDGFDLGDYRYAVAKYVKLLIRARATAEPDFLSHEQYQRWKLSNIAADAYSIERLLQLAAAAHDHLWRNFIGPHGSGGGPRRDDLPLWAGEGPRSMPRRTPTDEL